MAKIALFLTILCLVSTTLSKKYLLFEDDFSDARLFEEKWKAKSSKHFRYGGRREEFKIKPSQHGRDAFIETEIKLHHHDKPPHLRIKALVVRKSYCDNHYIILRSEGLTDKVPGQHPGVALFTAGMGQVGGTYAHTGQFAYIGWKCDKKILYVPGHKEETKCSLHKECAIDVTLNSTTIIFKDQCGCKTLRVDKYIYPRRKTLHLILGAHTLASAAHGAIFKNIKVYSVDDPEEDDEELEEIDLEHHLHYHNKSLNVGKTGKVDASKTEEYLGLLKRRRMEAKLEAEMKDDGIKID